jgi:formiminoglutamate deiminase
MTRYWAQQAWLGEGGTRTGVLVEVTGDRIAAVTTGVASPPPGTIGLTGLLLPGLANSHSHAFHRALRGRTHAGGGGTFWTWREQMYTLAGGLDPDTYHALARATFAEMALAGITCVGEFHYLHHAPGGVRYADPNEMGHRLIAAAAEAGIRITLLDTLYLSSTVDGAPLAGPQLRFGDGEVASWAARVEGLTASSHARRGAAVHSVRAVAARHLSEVVRALPLLRPDTVTSQKAAGDFAVPVHVHLSEQRAENEQCLAVHGVTPTRLLAEHGLLGPDLTAVHATHLSDEDRTRLGQHRANVCFCPTTERDLADGIGPARALADAGASLCLGSDSHAVIDLLEEARAVELDERLRDERRGRFNAGELLAAASTAGHRALGWPDAGRIVTGARADLVTVRLDTVRTAGHDPATVAAAVVFAATAADINDVICDGRPIVRDGQHLLVADPAGALAGAIDAAWERV